MSPDFVDEALAADIWSVAQATCFIVIEIKSASAKQSISGATAFFIDNRTLLTAGHNVMTEPKSHISVRALLPGTPVVSTDFKGIIKGIGVSTLTLEIVENYWRNTPETDIAILRTVGVTWAPHVNLELSDILTQDALVNVLGYPAEYSDRSLAKEYGEVVPDALFAGYDEARKTLPKWTLVTSCGPVLTVGENLEYRLSTINGMSGGPVVYNGKVYGIS